MDSTVTTRRKLRAGEASATISNLRRRITMKLTARGVSRMSYRYSNESRQHSYYPVERDERVLDRLGVDHRLGIYVHAVTPGGYPTDPAARAAAFAANLRLCAEMAEAGIVCSFQQNHSGDTGQILVWADENRGR